MKLESCSAVFALVSSSPKVIQIDMPTSITSINRLIYRATFTWWTLDRIECNLLARVAHEWYEWGDPTMLDSINCFSSHMFVSVHEPVIVSPERSSILICWLTDCQPVGGSPRPLTARIQPSSAVNLNIFGLNEGVKSGTLW